MTVCYLGMHIDIPKEFDPEVFMDGTSTSATKLYNTPNPMRWALMICESKMNGFMRDATI